MQPMPRRRKVPASLHFKLQGHRFPPAVMPEAIAIIIIINYRDGINKELSRLSVRQSLQLSAEGKTIEVSASEYDY